MIKAVIFDCFGVLVLESLLSFRDKAFGDSPKRMAEAVKLGNQADGGYINFDDYMQALSDLSGVPPTQVRSEITHNPANKQLLEYIETKLKPKYKLGILSNAADNWLDELLTPQKVVLFDAVSLSYETGFVKPDRRSYMDIAKRLGVGISECIFIDDQERYAIAARDAGMQALTYTNLDKFYADITKVLFNSNS